MAEFRTDAADYRRYGLDDPRCGVRRPAGAIRLTIQPSGWEIETEARRWSFDQPPFVRKLHDRFELHFSQAEANRAGLMVLVPFEALSSSETAVLEGLAERRHPKNAPGDFYGVADECICFGACAPAEVAPDLVGYQDEPEGCYFIRQPETEEVDRAIDALLSAFVENLRYGGADPRILQRVRAATRNMKLHHCQGDLCDYPSPEPQEDPVPD